MDDVQRKLIEALGARMAAVRRERRLTQEQVADLAEVDIQALRRAENGRSALPYHRLQRVAHALGVTLADMFAFDEIVPEPPVDPSETRLVATFRALPFRRRPWALRMVEALKDDL